MTIEEKVKRIIRDKLKIDPSEIVSEAKLRDDLGADSLDAIELIMSIEYEFEIEIPDEDAEKWFTVGDLAKYLEEKIAKLNLRQSLG